MDWEGCKKSVDLVNTASYSLYRQHPSYLGGDWTNVVNLELVQILPYYFYPLLKLVYFNPITIGPFGSSLKALKLWNGVSESMNFLIFALWVNYFLFSPLDFSMAWN
jgi:hypothetical protein